MKNAIFQQEVTDKYIVYVFTVKATGGDDDLDDGKGGLDYGYICNEDGSNKSPIVRIGTILAMAGGYFNEIGDYNDIDPVYMSQEEANQLMAKSVEETESGTNATE